MLVGSWLLEDASSQEGWADLPPLPIPRQEVGVAAVDGLVYVLGGIEENRATSVVVERYDVVEQTWKRTADLPRALHHVGAASLGGKIYCVGGLNSNFRGVTSCYRFDPADETVEWRKVASMSTARGSMGVAVGDGKIYAVGGQSGGTSYNVLEVYTPGDDGGQWDVRPPMKVARNHLAAVVADGYFYAIAGRSGRLRDEVERFDPVREVWENRKDIPTARGGIAAAVVGGSIFVFGGEGNSADPFGIFAQVERYDVELDEWSTESPMSVPRHGIGAAVIADRVFIPGGSDVQGFGTTDSHTVYVPDDEILPRFTRGDANADDAVDIADPLSALFWLFLGRQPRCPDAADADDDGEVAIDDVVILLRYLFLKGEPPAAPYPDASTDPSVDLLGCSL